jgi:hypothetical protein
MRSKKRRNGKPSPISSSIICKTSSKMNPRTPPPSNDNILPRLKLETLIESSPYLERLHTKQFDRFPPLRDLVHIRHAPCFPQRKTVVQGLAKHTKHSAPYSWFCRKSPLLPSLLT